MKYIQKIFVLFLVAFLSFSQINITTVEADDPISQNWNYRVSLTWADYTEDDVTRVVTEGTGYQNDASIKANVVITTQQVYEANSIEIRIPAYLYDNVYSSGNNATKNAEVGTANSSYTHTFDSATNEIVITNNVEITGSTNTIIPINYYYQPYLTQDLSTATLTAKAQASYKNQFTDGSKEKIVPNTISLTLDTGLTMPDVQKVISTQLNAWNSSENKWLSNISASTPSWFDTENYNYFLYYPENDNSYFKVMHGQAYDFDAKISASDNGSVVGAYMITTPIINNTKIDVRSKTTNQFTDNGDGTYSLSFNEKQYTDRSDANNANRDLSYTYENIVQMAYVVAYPKTQQQRNTESMGDATGSKTYETDYTSTMDVSVTANQSHPDDKVDGKDKNDVVTAQVDGNAHYISFTFDYQGDVYSGGKRALNPTRYNGRNTVDLFGMGSDVYVAYESNFSVNAYDGVNFEGTYHFEHIDDAVAVSYLDENKNTVRSVLTKDDFAFTDFVDVTIEVAYINQSSGEIVDTYPTEPFKLYGLNENDEWVLIADLTMDARTFEQTVQLSQDYYGLKVVTPNGLQDHVKVTMQENIRINGNSSVAEAYKNYNFSSLSVVNFVKDTLYQEKDGQSILVDVRESTPYDNYSTIFGIDANDTQDYGGYVFRNSATKVLGLDTGSLGANKGTSLVSVTDTEVTRSFYLQVNTNTYYSINAFYNNTDAWKEMHTISNGVFYDLLPYGYYLDESVTPYVGNTQNNYYTADLTYETIDNYNNSGRQMVIFTLKKTSEEYNYYIVQAYGEDALGTYLRINFQAKGNKEDLISGETYRNTFLYQKLDGTKVLGGFSSDNRAKNVDPTDSVVEDAYNAAVVPGTLNTLGGFTTFSDTWLTAYETGAKKTVKGLSDTFSSEDAVLLDGTYIWRLSLVTAETEGTTSGIGFMDIIEDANGANKTGWKGTLESIDTGYAKLLGAEDITIYYSTKSGLTYPQSNEELDNALNDTSIWSTEEPEDLSKVTAVYVYLGDDFAIGAKSQVFVNLYMKAPDTYPSQEYAYNDFAYTSTFTPAGGMGTTSTNHVNSAKISIPKLVTHFPVEKKIEGTVRNSTSYQTFTFVVEGLDNAPMPSDAVNGKKTISITDTTGVIGSIGTSSFGNITYYHPGTYRYQVSEVAPTTLPTGYTYATTNYEIEVTVVEENAQLIATYEIVTDGDTDQAITTDVVPSLEFINTYVPLETTVTIPLTKEITGSTRNEQQKTTFSFTLLGTDVNDTKTITDEGSTNFDTLTFTKEGTYTYTISETDDGVTGYTYDTSIYTVVITVEDVAGQLTASYVITDSEDSAFQSTNLNDIVFENRYATGNVVVHYVDEDGNPILDDKTVIENGTINDPYRTDNEDDKPQRITTPDGRVYEFVKVHENSAPESGNVTAGTTEVTYVYKEVTGNVIVHFVDEDGNVIRSDENDTVNGSINTTYDTTDHKYPVIAFKGKKYELVRVHANSASETGTVVEGITEVTYVYRLLPDAPSTDDDNPNTPDTENRNDRTVTPKTGDTNEYVGTFGMSLIALITMILFRKKEFQN